MSYFIDSSMCIGLCVKCFLCIISCNIHSNPVRSGPLFSEVKASACNAGDLGSVPRSGRSPGEGNGSPFQYSCLENPMDRGAWWATVHRVSNSWTRLSDLTNLDWLLTTIGI